MCRGCWWNEGGRCYVGDPPRDENGRSKIEAKERCDKFQSKRQVLSTVIPNDKLVITSEKKMNLEHRAKIKEMQQLREQMDKLHREIDDHVVAVAKRYIVAAHRENSGYGYPTVSGKGGAWFEWEIGEEGDVDVTWEETWSYGGHDGGSFTVPANFIWDEKALVAFEEKRAREKADKKAKDEARKRAEELEQLKKLQEKYGGEK